MGVVLYYKLKCGYLHNCIVFHDGSGYADVNYHTV
jgi:hypothetical protein